MGLFRLIFRSITRSQGRTASKHYRAEQRTTTIVKDRSLTSVVQQTVRVESAPQTISGTAYVIDGDTVIIQKTRIRLAGIDAPELNHPWGQKSKWAVVAMCKGQIVTAHLDGSLSHDRVVGTCYLPDGRDIAAELVKQGLAIDWPKYSGGKYRALEQDGVRKRLWRAHQRQRGRFPRNG